MKYQQKGWHNSFLSSSSGATTGTRQMKNWLYENGICILYIIMFEIVDFLCINEKSKYFLKVCGESTYNFRTLQQREEDVRSCLDYEFFEATKN